MGCFGVLCVNDKYVPVKMVLCCEVGVDGLGFQSRMYSNPRTDTLGRCLPSWAPNVLKGGVGMGVSTWQLIVKIK